MTGMGKIVSLAAFALASTPVYAQGDLQATAADPKTLWQVPLEALRASRERPLFTPTRRPAPAAAQERSGPTATRFDLTLTGIVRSDDGAGVALLKAQGDGPLLRVKVGQYAQEWRVISLGRRAVVLEKNGEQRTLSLPALTAKGDAQPERNAPGAADTGEPQPGPIPLFR